MFNLFSQAYDDSAENLTIALLDNLREAVSNVKKARRWFQVNPLSKAFIKGLFLMKMSRVKSILLMKAIIKTIRELKHILSRESRLIEIGIREAWRLSELASSWGHKYAREWRNNRNYIILQALTLQWLSKLFSSIIKM